MRKINYECLVVDEAHKIKNYYSISNQALSYIKAKFKLLLTGTPLSNNLRELWSLLNFILPQLFTNQNLFDEIEDCVNSFEGSEEGRIELQCQVAKKFHKIITLFMKRRTKAELDLGLPRKTESTLFVPVSNLQVKMYKNMIKYHNVYGDEGGDRILNRTMQLRKICNHPYVFENIQVNHSLGEHIVENCGKLQVLDLLLEKLVKEGKKVLIFSQFTIVLDILMDYC